MPAYKTPSFFIPQSHPIDPAGSEPLLGRAQIESGRIRCDMGRVGLTESLDQSCCCRKQRILVDF